MASCVQTLTKTNGELKTTPPLHRHPTALIVVAGGALLGGLLRVITTWAWGDYLGVLACNSVGAFVLGLVMPLLNTSTYRRRIVCTGLLGTLTTYSSIMILSIRSSAGMGYLLLTLAVGFFAALVGLLVGLECSRYVSYRRLPAKSTSGSEVLGASETAGLSDKTRQNMKVGNTGKEETK